MSIENPEIVEEMLPLFDEETGEVLAEDFKCDEDMGEESDDVGDDESTAVSLDNEGGESDE